MRAFDDATRRNIADACASFARLPDAAEPSALKRAAVVLALTASHDGDDTAFLLTKRASSLRSHRGQWALPGGRCDAGETPVEAALRELDEELALRLPTDAVLGLLDDYPTRSGYLITPVVVWAAESNAITPNPDEVASVHRIALDTIERDDAFDFTAIPRKQPSRDPLPSPDEPDPRADGGADLPVPRGAGGAADPRHRPGTAGVRLEVTQKKMVNGALT